ncbi:hypothetical protein PRIPAC_92737, partial [Pristionchus pacificus]|uniref:Uncharacterized protein n=1 Tax=Pristionchus pacificus TaxID=54126 RepID=A0A2A6CDV7_PRIPA
TVPFLALLTSLKDGRIVPPSTTRLEMALSSLRPFPLSRSSDEEMTDRALPRSSHFTEGRKNRPSLDHTTRDGVVLSSSLPSFSFLR